MSATSPHREPWAQALALWHLARDEHRSSIGAGTAAAGATEAKAEDAAGAASKGASLPSPDGRWALQRIGHDIALVDQPDGALLARTHDGEPDWAYGAWPDVGLCSVGLQRSGRTPPPCARWSPDSRWAVIARTDQRAVRQLRLTDPLGLDGHVTEHLQRVPLPGDAHLPLTTLILLDVRSPGFVALDLPPLVSNYAPIVPETADPVLAALLPSDIGIVRWIGDRLVIINEQRGWKAVHVLVVDPATRVVEERLHETGSTHVQLAAQRYPAQLTLLSDGSLVFYSERSGWGQLWLKPPQGEPRALTQGAWTVRHLHRVDEARRTVVFSASGREPGVDPYYRLLYSLPLDGGEPRRWTPEDADHEVHFDEPRRRWVAQWSRVDHPGARVEFDEDGATVNEHPIESPYEDAQLRAAPRRFCVKAADGVTPLYGVLFMPLQRTPGARIPLLDYMYGAPQRTQARVRFSLSGSVRADDTLALTSLGFAVFVLDGRGTPMRGKAFHDSSWGPGHADACGLADHAAAVAQLVLQLPDLDAGRVGIYGASGGGYAAARAVLQYPDVFHAAFAAAGNHDQRLYCARYERYLGLLPESAAHYDAADNTALAGELRRPLLLAHGLLDDDVHPIATLRLAAALQRAGKPVELLVVPQGGHAIDQLDDVLIRKWQFFCEHLRPVISECGKMSS